ncbi:unnamed protein product [Calypogeia fissa]
MVISLVYFHNCGSQRQAGRVDWVWCPLLLCTHEAASYIVAERLEPALDRLE